MCVGVRERWVHFEIGDVSFPEPAEILRELHGKELLQGKVVDFSDGGGPGEGFVVVEVEGLARPVVVPISRVKGVL